MIKVDATKEELSPKKVQETKKVNIETTKDPKLLNLGVTFSEEYVGISRDTEKGGGGESISYTFITFSCFIN